MQKSGFGNVGIRDISQAVMNGFANWVKNRNGRDLPMMSRWKYRITGTFLQWAYTNSILQYCIVTAEKEKR